MASRPCHLRHAYNEETSWEHHVFVTYQICVFVVRSKQDALGPNPFFRVLCACNLQQGGHMCYYLSRLNRIEKVSLRFLDM